MKFKNGLKTIPTENIQSTNCEQRHYLEMKILTKESTSSGILIETIKKIRKIYSQY